MKTFAYKSLLVALLVAVDFVLPSAAEWCPNLNTAFDASSLPSFSAIDVEVNCPKGGTTTKLNMPKSVNWHISSKGDVPGRRSLGENNTSLAIHMTPENVVQPYVVSNEFRFALVPENWPGTGDIGIEIVVPLGQVTHVGANGDNQEVQICGGLGGSLESLEVDGDSNTVSVSADYAQDSSSRRIQIELDGDSNNVQVKSPGGAGVNMDGDSNTLHILGDVAVCPFLCLHGNENFCISLLTLSYINSFVFHSAMP